MLINLKKSNINIDNIFISSDFHFRHVNICRGVSTWNNKDENCRDFDNEIDMSNKIVENINSIVKKDNILIHLGDIAFGKIENTYELFDRLECKNLILINGNHCHEHSLKHSSILYQVDYLELRCRNNLLITCFHYPMTIWNECHKNSLNLFGHSHGKHQPKGRSKDVGLDTNNLFPYKLTDVIKELEQIPIYSPNELSH